MLDFFLHYPLKSYLRNFLLRPIPTAGFYMSPSNTTVAILEKHGSRVGFTGFSAELHETEGAPTLHMLDPQNADEDTFRAATSYSHTIAPLYHLQQGEDTLLVLDDPECYVNILTTDTKFAQLTVEKFCELLRDDAESIIPGWRNYEPRGAYMWEILGLDFERIPDTSAMPARAVLVGIPGAKADFMGEWSGLWGGCLRGIYPGGLLAIWAAKRIFGSKPFFILYNRKSGGFIAAFDKGINKLWTPTRNAEFPYADIQEILTELKSDNFGIFDSQTPLLAFGVTEMLRRQLTLGFPVMPKFAASILKELYALRCEDASVTTEVWLITEAMVQSGILEPPPPARISVADMAPDETTVPQSKSLQDSDPPHPGQPNKT